MFEDKLKEIRKLYSDKEVESNGWKESATYYEEQYKNLRDETQIPLMIFYFMLGAFTVIFFRICCGG